jgi:hypothetical protein
MFSCIDVCLKVLVDGYISQCFTPKHAERYFFCLLKSNSIAPYPAWHAPGIESAFFFVPSVPKHVSDQFADQSRWVLDRGILHKGTVVRQRLWAPHTLTDKKHHVEQAELQLPIFFQCADGRLGLSLEAAAAGRCHSLTNAQTLAPLGEKSTTHVRILVSGAFGVAFCSLFTELVYLLVAGLRRVQAPGSNSR